MNIPLTSKTDEWSTPRDLFHKLDMEFNFTLDPCATKENTTCKRYYTKDDNGLSKSWKNEVVFLNPPFGREIKKWIQKAYKESQEGTIVVCLIPARTDTIYWHDYCMKGEIRFICRRLKFGCARHNAPFPSAIVIFRPPPILELNNHRS